MPEPTLQLTIMSIESIIFDGEVTAVSLVNETGNFDILPQHTNFISPVQDSIIIWSGRQRKQINIERGIIHVRNNRARIFTGLAAPTKSVANTKPEPSQAVEDSQVAKKKVK